MKFLEETPPHICDKGDTNYVAYSDTDSIYVNAQPMLEFLYPDFNSRDTVSKDNLCETLALKYQDIITDSYDELAKNCFHVPDTIGDQPHVHRLEMKTEAVIRAAYFRATRRYAQWITKQEGISKEVLDIKGLEFMKANFPPLFGKFFNDILQQILKGASQPDILKQAKVFKKEILDGTIPLQELGNPTSVKKLNKYMGAKSRAGEVFTTILNKAPAPVRAAIRYNDLLKLWRLDKKHGLITQADKIKWIYLKENPYKIDKLAYFPHDIPDKIQEFFDQYADREKVFEGIVLNKLEGMFMDLGWSLDLNPYVNIFSKFEI